VRQANFFVLRNSYMPAVLVECGFISNSSEEKLLRRGEFREKMARGVAAGLVRFLREYERRINGT
jgi:N-acetylmuramoyl-L-alanine amidase